MADELMKPTTVLLGTIHVTPECQAIGQSPLSVHTLHINWGNILKMAEWENDIVGSGCRCAAKLSKEGSSITRFLSCEMAKPTFKPHCTGRSFSWQPGAFCLRVLLALTLLSDWSALTPRLI